MATDHGPLHSGSGSHVNHVTLLGLIGVRKMKMERLFGLWVPAPQKSLKINFHLLTFRPCTCHVINMNTHARVEWAMTNGVTRLKKMYFANVPNLARFLAG